MQKINKAFVTQNNLIKNHTISKLTTIKNASYVWQNFASIPHCSQLYSLHYCSGVGPGTVRAMSRGRSKFSCRWLRWFDCRFFLTFINFLPECIMRKSSNNLISGRPRLVDRIVHRYTVYTTVAVWLRVPVAAFVFSSFHQQVYYGSEANEIQK